MRHAPRAPRDATNQRGINRPHIQAQVRQPGQRAQARMHLMHTLMAHSHPEALQRRQPAQLLHEEARLYHPVAAVGVHQTKVRQLRKRRKRGFQHRMHGIYRREHRATRVAEALTRDLQLQQPAQRAQRPQDAKHGHDAAVAAGPSRALAGRRDEFEAERCQRGALSDRVGDRPNGVSRLSDHRIDGDGHRGDGAKPLRVHLPGRDVHMHGGTGRVGAVDDGEVRVPEPLLAGGDSEECRDEAAGHLVLVAADSKGGEGGQRCDGDRKDGGCVCEGVVREHGRGGVCVVEEEVAEGTEAAVDAAAGERLQGAGGREGEREGGERGGGGERGDERVEGGRLLRDAVGEDARGGDLAAVGRGEGGRGVDGAAVEVLERKLFKLRQATDRGRERVYGMLERAGSRAGGPRAAEGEEGEAGEAGEGAEDGGGGVGAVRGRDGEAREREGAEGGVVEEHV